MSTSKKMNRTETYFRNTIERVAGRVTDSVIDACGGVERRPITAGSASQTRVFEHITNSTPLERWSIRVSITVEKIP